ncbi:MAG TPA: hypothetical protein VLI90_00965 [Tepidisphaeraceae bacterium]|nr:hypothetical protein [Tepidisphaeraceae bacterium]
MQNAARFWSILALVGCLISPHLARGASAAAPVTVTIDSANPGAIIPDDFTGFSFEIQTLLPDKDGKRMFTADNKPLIALFKQLGIKSLRVGGNTADNRAVAVPDEKDADSLIAFARAAGAKVIYTLRLRGGGKPEDVEPIAKYLMSHYKDEITCLAVGNEPNVYAKEYPACRELITRYINAITAPDVAPDAMFCGPSTTPGKGEWAASFAKEFGPGGHVKFISQHSYPGGNARKVPDPRSGRDKLLEPSIAKSYQKMYDAFVSATIEAKLPYRLEETNSYFNGGAENVSNTQMSALWALDYLHWWAAHGAAGMNFHTGDAVAAGDKPTPCWYATFWTVKDGYNVHPIGYAIKAFDIAGKGRSVPVKVESTDGVNLTGYAVAADQALYVTLINREHDENARAATITLSTIADYPHRQMMLLSAPDNDIAATSGVALGGAPIDDAANWSGKWTAVSASEFEVPPSSAAVLKLSK